MENRDEQIFDDWLEKDKINNFNELSCELQTREIDGWLMKNNGQYWSFYRIEDVTTSKPTLVAAIKIFSDLSVHAFSSHYPLL